MEWELNVPKILHVYWGGKKLSYLRYLTVLTFIKLNPDWDVRFYYPTIPTTHIPWRTGEQNLPEPQTDFTSELMNLPITKTAINFRDYGFKNELSEVHKSDVIRLHLLSTVGGLWSDMDIFYFKPISLFHLNSEKYKNIETFYCNHDYGHSIGFLMSTPGNKFFESLLNISKSLPPLKEYQTFGATMYNTHFRAEGTIQQITPAMNMSMEVVYSHRAGDTNELLSTNPPKFKKESIGIHWYAGDQQWKDFLIKTDGGLKNIPDCVIGDLIKGFNT